MRYINLHLTLTFDIDQYPEFSWHTSMVQGYSGCSVNNILVHCPVFTDLHQIGVLMGRCSEAERQLQQIFDALPHQSEIMSTKHLFKARSDLFSLDFSVHNTRNNVEAVANSSL